MGITLLEDIILHGGPEGYDSRVYQSVHVLAGSPCVFNNHQLGSAIITDCPQTMAPGIGSVWRSEITAGSALSPKHQRIL
ncbi:hypothetical protein GDO78_010751 [Eleutherodactylus coqui]|uniref:Uncharacterized protein n=1 Tax=Eleutherodactylus coqui TaxID=57060 RepID=A0A8J6F7V3_ELECQ|nr:hypothetical protein GDO78_010751 [Eleutherodactylus coqui]